MLIIAISVTPDFSRMLRLECESSAVLTAQSAEKSVKTARFHWLAPDTWLKPGVTEKQISHRWWRAEESWS